jgi:beta-1,4-mannosyl-glycoprotein beta-1,4-N-acetylglucosaminyltransferase
MKVFDCFTFFNELDLLEFRMKLLESTVDYFVIAESNLTHAGAPKPWNFEEAKSRFAQWEHKIIYLKVVQSTEGLDFTTAINSYTPTSAAWQLENEQRMALQQINSRISDNDIVIVSDLDEMPNPQVLKRIKPAASPLSLSMIFHYYFLNCQNVGDEHLWNGSIVCTGSQFKQIGSQVLRDNRNNYPRIKKAGWHFSYLGGVEKIKYKIQSFAHTEFNKDEYLQDEQIINAMLTGKDIFNRPGAVYKFVSPYRYPAFLRNIMFQYNALLYYPKKEKGLQKIIQLLAGKFSN